MVSSQKTPASANSHRRPRCRLLGLLSELMSNAYSPATYTIWVLRHRHGPCQVIFDFYSLADISEAAKAHNRKRHVSPAGRRREGLCASVQRAKSPPTAPAAAPFALRAGDLLSSPPASPTSPSSTSWRGPTLPRRRLKARVARTFCPCVFGVDVICLLPPPSAPPSTKRPILVGVRRVRRVWDRSRHS